MIGPELRTHYDGLGFSERLGDGSAAGTENGQGTDEHPQDAGDMESGELTPEGPCGFEPLHLRQASGFAGGR